MKPLSFSFPDILVARSVCNCYSKCMKKNSTKSKSRSGEQKALIAFLVIFVTVIVIAWGYALKLRQTVATNNSIMSADPSALIEVERVRNLAESQIANARSFFLLGSKVLYDKQKQDKQTLTEALSSFEKKYNLPQIPQIIKDISVIQQQHQEFFDQAMDFREKQTESKIVGQFYQSKTAPLLKQINDNLDEIKRIHLSELESNRAEARQAASGVEVQIPQGMAWLTGLMGFIFLGLSVIITRMLRERSRQLAERDRLYNEAQNAVLSRDEYISALSHDLKEPLSNLNQIADILKNFSDSAPVHDSSELVKTSVHEIENLIKNIGDQKVSGLEGLTLRLDQMGIDDVLEDARLMMSPLAKKKDVRLQFDSANPPVLAFLDRERVMRVLANLVGNAIKFSPKNGKVVVKVRSDQQFVNISVTDSGPGIPEKKLAEIFDHFWQSRKTANQGAGVGLAVVKTIVEAHGGTVKVDSHSGSGSTFTFSLPRRRPAGAQLKKAAPIRYTTNTRPQSDIYNEGPSL